MEESKYEKGLVAFNNEKYAQSMTILLPFAEEGDIRAQLSVASMYFSGLGVKQDYKEAEKWYRPAAEKGHPVAQHSLAMTLLSLNNIYEAVEYLLKASDQDIIFSKSCLADIFTGAYEFSEDAQKTFGITFKEALQLYQEAGEGGFSYAFHRLGDIYANGQGIKQSDLDAVKFYRKAAENGYKPSQKVLALAYQDGQLSLPVNQAKSQYWHQKIQGTS